MSRFEAAPAACHGMANAMSWTDTTPPPEACTTLPAPLSVANSHAAVWPVHAGSTRNSVKFLRVARKQAVQLYHRARAWDRHPVARGKGNRPVRYHGRIGAAAMKVLECLLFDFLNYRTGRLDPSYESIARMARLGRTTVWQALIRLRDLGIIAWVRRCVDDTGRDGRYQLRQVSNAYAILPPSQWRGFSDERPSPPAPHPDSWGQARKSDDEDVAPLPAARIDVERARAWTRSSDPVDREMGQFLLRKAIEFGQLTAVED